MICAICGKTYAIGIINPGRTTLPFCFALCKKCFKERSDFQNYRSIDDIDLWQKLAGSHHKKEI